MFYSTVQLRVTISSILRDQLEDKAQKMGLTMSAYVKNLIIQDLKQQPTLQVSNIIQNFKKPFER